MAFVGVILNPMQSLQALLWPARPPGSPQRQMPGRASTMRVSTYPSNCWNSICSMALVVAVGKFCTKSVLLGGSLPTGITCKDQQVLRTQASHASSLVCVTDDEGCVSYAQSACFSIVARILLGLSPPCRLPCSPHDSE